ncbi:MAG: dihydrodipicolinate synthase family protein [Planctomycetia bacterium]|nr:dihydrodipicolinate synthase family protein [Planctomycetia bacterium]
MILIFGRSTIIKRYPAGILCTCVVPWDEHGEFIEHLFVDEVQRILQLTPHLYVFGTAGEGYAVNNRQFERIVTVFHRVMREAGAETMVGLVSLSLPTIIERIEWCRQQGVRDFQISLPSWGALADDEVRSFFKETCGRFGDCRFLHYNLLRAKRLVTPALYGELAEAHPNLVATKNTGDSMLRLEELMRRAPQLQHFPGEIGFVYASQLGECGLLASLATNHTACREFFGAGQRRDLPALLLQYAEIARIFDELVVAVGPGEHIDGAYDKVLWKVCDNRFPLRLLPPYAGATDAAFERFANFLRVQTPRWAPEAR